MTLRKRTLALLLTVCLLLSVAVPMVSAADLFIKMQLGTNNPANYLTLENNFDVTVVEGKSYSQIQFKQSHSGNAWVAIRIKDTAAFAAGEYHLNLHCSAVSGKGGKADVYLLPDTDKTGADLTAYIEANMTDSTFTCQVDSITGGLSDHGAATVGESFILVFKSVAGQTAENGTDIYIRVGQVNLVPVLTAADADGLADALTTIADSAGGRFSTVKLTADFAAGDVVIPANVTLDLNGHTLTVDSINSDYKHVGTGSVQIAGQGGGTVTPPAGGEGGGTVTPPAGGEGGGADTPAQTGDTSPVLFAVVALAASLLAMVALIPNKKRA